MFVCCVSITLRNRKITKSENLWFLINTHTLAIDKRACSILAMIRSISELFWSGVGAHVTVDGSVFGADIVWCSPPPLIDDSPILLVLLAMILDRPADAIVYLLLTCPMLVDSSDDVVDSIRLGFDDDDLDLYDDFNSNCNSSHLTVSNAAWDDWNERGLTI